jgi:aquaporin Z
MNAAAWRKYAAEALGTFVLVFSGVGSAVLAGKLIGNLGIALAFGLALLVMVYAIGPISGCHINPAVTLGLLLSRKVAARDAVGYWVAQVVGAIVAAGVLLIIVKDVPGGYDAASMGFGANGYDTHSPGHYGLGAAFLAEVILTFFLVFTVLGATDVKAPVGFAGLAIGLVLVVDHLVGIPVDNLSVNPARSIGPALFVGGWALQQLWLFIVAPLIGGVIAAGVYRVLRQPDVPITTRAAEQALPSQQTERVAPTP